MWQDIPVDGAEPESFRFWLAQVGADRWRCYHLGDRLKKMNPATFRAFSYCYFGDDTSVHTVSGPVQHADARSFEACDTGVDVVNGSLFPTGYGKDKLRVYYCDAGRKGVELKGVIATEFRSLSPLYGTDGAKVYFGRSALPKCDPTTWQRLEGHYSADASRVYYCNRPVVAADRDTFQVVRTIDGHPILAKDKLRYYSLSESVELAVFEAQRSG